MKNSLRILSGMPNILDAQCEPRQTDRQTDRYSSKHRKIGLVVLMIFFNLLMGDAQSLFVEVTPSDLSPRANCAPITLDIVAYNTESVPVSIQVGIEIENQWEDNFFASQYPGFPPTGWQVIIQSSGAKYIEKTFIKIPAETNVTDQIELVPMMYPFVTGFPPGPIIHPIMPRNMT